MVGFEKDFNLVPFLGLVITVVAMMWFAFQRIDTGYIYTIMFLVPITLLFASFLFIDESSKKGIIGKLKIPFTTSTTGGAALLLAGWIIYITINFLGSLASKGFSLVSFNIPLAAQQTNTLIAQTAAELSIVTSDSVRLFTTVFVASFIEEFIFRFIVIYISYILVMFIYQGIAKKKPSHNMTLVFAFIVTGISFAFIHKLNGSYDTISMFVVATVFSLLLSASIYYAGAFLSFTICFHQANNFVWFVSEHGWPAVQKALFTPLGLIMIAYMIVMIIIVLNNLKPANKFLVSVIKDFRKGVRL